MAVPKKRTSSSKRGMRQSHRKIAKTQVCLCSHCGMSKVAHNICKSCGYYRGIKISKLQKEILK